MTATKLDPRRHILCGRTNAERLAIRMSEGTGKGHAVIRTGSEIQPFRVLAATDGDPDAIELQVVLL